MHKFKTLSIGTKFVISLVLSFTLLAFGCSSTKNQKSDLEDIQLIEESVTEDVQTTAETETVKEDTQLIAEEAPTEIQLTGLEGIQITAEAVAEGIRVSFSNYSDIPNEIDALMVAFRDWGNRSNEPNWENINMVSGFQYIHDMLQINSDNVIEQVRQTGTLVSPFSQPGHTYIITAYFIKGEEAMKPITTKCIARSGTYLAKNVSLDLNDTYTSVALSKDLKFTSEVRFASPKIVYTFILLTDYDFKDFNSGHTDNLYWDFEPNLTGHLLENNLPGGNYLAFVEANLKIIYDNITWSLEIAKSPIFTYRF